MAYFGYVILCRGLHKAVLLLLFSSKRPTFAVLVPPSFINEDIYFYTIKDLAYFTCLTVMCLSFLFLPWTQPSALLGALLSKWAGVPPLKTYIVTLLGNYGQEM